MKRRGFTLIELLVVVAIIALLIAILLPSLGKARELANRGTCAANVRGIAQSMHVYGADNNDAYPSVPAPTGNSASTSFYKLAASTNPNTPGSTTTDLTYLSIYNTHAADIAGSPMACLWILCIRGDVASKQFICKSDPLGSAASPIQNAGTPPIYNTNFNDSANVANSDQHYSYSVAYPWTPATSSAPGGWWKATSDASNVLMSDMSPQNQTGSTGQLSTPGNSYQLNTKFSNSVHHQRDGQNVSFGDAHAEFQRTPFVGQNGDNVFTQGQSGPGSPMATSNPITTSGSLPTNWNPGSSGSYDTILVPASHATTNVRY